MEELVALLRNARNAKNLSLEEISEQTKVSLHLLEAIEKHDLSCFAAEVYLKGVIGSYARAVGYEPREIIDMYNRIREEEENKSLQNKKGINRQKEIVVKRKKIKKQESMSFFSTGVYTFLFLFLFSGIWFFLSRDTNNNKNAGNDSGVSISQDEETDSESKDETKEREDNETTVIDVAVIDSNDYESSWEISGADNLEMKLVLEGNCWIDLYVDSSNVHQRTFSRGAAIDVTAEKEIKVRLGYPPAVSIFINDVEIEGLRDKHNPYNCIFIKAE